LAAISARVASSIRTLIRVENANDQQGVDPGLQGFQSSVLSCDYDGPQAIAAIGFELTTENGEFRGFLSGQDGSTCLDLIDRFARIAVVNGQQSLRLLFATAEGGSNLVEGQIDAV